MAVILDVPEEAVTRLAGRLQWPAHGQLVSLGDLTALVWRWPRADAHRWVLEYISKRWVLRPAGGDYTPPAECWAPEYLRSLQVHVLREAAVYRCRRPFMREHRPAVGDVPAFWVTDLPELKRWAVRVRRAFVAGAWVRG